MNRKAVFVSSTFSDLKAHRASVRAAIRRLGATDVAMEDFGSRDDRPLRECIRVIKSESDIFVGIYAHQYGYVPDRRKTSITASEYSAARKAELPILAYLIDESASWPKAKRDEAVAATRLQSFKARLMKQHIVSFFSKKDELATMVAADVGRHLAAMQHRLETVRKLSGESQERERRLLNTLLTSSGAERERAVSALRGLGSDAALPTLIQLMLGPDEKLAFDAAKALEWSGHISHGIFSQHSRVRWWAAFRIGENALQDHDWGLQQLDSVINLLEGKGEQLDVMEQATHTLGKIGGPKARDAIVKILRQAGTPPLIAATALHAPPRFWADGMFASSASYNLIPQFVNDAIDAVSSWSPRFCSAVARSDRFKYMTASIRQAVERGRSARA